MARLTEKELDLIQRTRQAPWAAHDVDAVVLYARHLRSEFMARQLALGARALVRWTRLDKAAALVADAVARPIRKALIKRRTVRELRRLDDHMLLDLGLTRGDVEAFAGTLAEKRLPSRPGLGSRLRAWFQRQRTIRALEALDDRLLADIGLERGRIAAAVDLAVSGGSRESAAPADLVDRTYAALRRWNLSRQAAREMSKLGPDVLSDLGYVKGDVDWVPEVLANRRVAKGKAA